MRIPVEQIVCVARLRRLFPQLSAVFSSLENLSFFVRLFLFVAEYFLLLSEGPDAIFRTAGKFERRLDCRQHGIYGSDGIAFVRTAFFSILSLFPLTPSPVPRNSPNALRSLVYFSNRSGASLIFLQI